MGLQLISKGGSYGLFEQCPSSFIKLMESNGISQTQLLGDGSVAEVTQGAHPTHFDAVEPTRQLVGRDK